MITQRPLLVVFHDIYESCKTKKQNRALYALFVAAICSNNSRRCSYIPEGYIQKEGFENYPFTVSGPCFELISLLAKNGLTDDVRLSASGLRKISASVTERYLKSSDINKDILYPDGRKVADYDKLSETITSVDLKAVYKTLANKRSEKELNKLIDESYSDLTWRITEYTDNENTRKKKETKNTVSNFSFSLASNKCEEAIKELNKKYNISSDEEKEKLERILLPIYSTSPYFSICIAHKNVLPEQIRKKTDGKTAFVFVLSFVSYLTDKENGTRKYTRTQNVFSYVQLKRIFGRDIRINRKIESFGSIYDQVLDRDYYTLPFYGNEKCCASSYKSMRAKYNQMLDNWEKYFVRNACQWIPIEPSENEDLINLLSDTGLFHERYEKKKYKISMKGSTRRKAFMTDEDTDKTERLLSGEKKDIIKQFIL